MFTAKKIRNVHLTTNVDYPQIRKILQRIFNAVKMPKYAVKNMRYAHFAKICKNAAKCQILGNRIFVFF